MFDLKAQPNSMITHWRRALSLLLLAVVYSCAAQQIANCTDGTVGILSSSSGPLKTFPSVKELTGNETFKCFWSIQPTNASYNIHLRIDKLSLSDNDTFTINSTDPKISSIVQLKGFQLPGIVLTSSKQVNVTLELAAENIIRDFDIVYSYVSNKQVVENLDGSGSFVFAYGDNKVNSVTDFELRFSPKQVLPDKVLIDFDTFNMTGSTISFQNVATTTATFTGLNGPPYLLSRDKQPIVVNITKFNLSAGNKLKLDYELVNYDCSQYIVIKKDDIDANFSTNVVLPNNTALQTLTDYRCFNMFDIPDQNTAILSLNIDRFNFINDGDMITVLDGDRRTSDTIALIIPEFYDYFKNLFLTSSSNKLSVIFDSPFVVNRTQSLISPLIEAKSEGGKVASNSNGTEIKVSQSTKTGKYPVVYTFEVEEGSQAIFSIKDNNLLPGNPNESFVLLYNSVLKSVNEPFVTLKSKTYPPNIVASDTNQLRVEFWSTDKDFTATLTPLRRGCHSTALGVSDSYSSIGCNEMCSWFIPNRGAQVGSFVLKFVNINLPTKDDSVTLEKFLYQKSTVFELTGPLKIMTLPDIILNSSNSYALYSKRKTCNQSDNALLFSVSMHYNAQDILNQTINLSKLEDKTLKSLNYPNTYPIGEQTFWNIQSANNTPVLLTFTDLQLAASHQLAIAGKAVNPVFTNATLSLPADYLVNTTPLIINLSAGNISSPPYSARGFALNISTVDCGAAVSLKVGQNQSLPTPTNWTEIKKCVWTVTVDNDKSNLNLIEFEESISALKDNSNGVLTVYDSNSVRDGNHKMNFSYFNQTSKSSSTNSIVIVYYANDTSKALTPLSMNFSTKACNNSLCDDKKRCLLKAFFCNGINDCGDWSDERNCQSPQPPPPPTPAPLPPPRGGVNGWVVLFVICPLCIALGVIGTIFGPTFMQRFRRGRYTEFQDFSEVS